MDLNPNDIELETMNKSFAYEKMARDIDEIGDINALRDLAKCYVKLYFKQQEVVAKIG